MKKFFSLFAAVLFAGSMMAESITITPAEFKSSYGDNTFTISSIGFAYSGAMYNAKGTPSGMAVKQFIQFRKSGNGAGELKNTTAVNMKSITFATQNDKPFTLSVGTAADALTDVETPAATDDTYTCQTSAGDETSVAVKIYTFDVEGNTYFQFLNGANAQYIAYFTIEYEPGEVTPIDPVDPVVDTITCLDVYQMNKNDVVGILNPVTVTYSNGANVWVKDASSSMLIYLPSGFTNNFQPGDILSGVSGTVDIYQTLVYEVKPSAAQAAAISVSQGEVPAAVPVVSIDESDVNKLVSVYGASLEGEFTTASKTSITATIGEETVTIYNQFNFAYTFEAGKTYDILGVVSAYKGNPQVYFISAAERTPAAISNTAVETKAVKAIRDGQLIIEMNGVRYNAQGAIVR